jgi:hypothetical protein
MWLDPVRLLGEAADTLVLTAPDGIRTWVERRYGRLINEAIAAVSDFEEHRFV